MTTTTAGQDIERINSVSLYRGSEEVVISLDRVGDRYEVGACRLYHTYQGARVGGTMERTFTDLDKARAYANGYWSWWRKKGFAPRRGR